MADNNIEFKAVFNDDDIDRGLENLSKSVGKSENAFTSLFKKVTNGFLNATSTTRKHAIEIENLAKASNQAAMQYKAVTAELKEQETTLKGLKEELKIVNDELALGPKKGQEEYKKLRDVQLLLSNAIEDNISSIKELKQEQSTLKTEALTTGAGNDMPKSASIDPTTAKEYTALIKEATAESKLLSDQIKQQENLSKDLQQQLEQVAQELGNSGDKSEEQVAALTDEYIALNKAIEDNAVATQNLRTDKKQIDEATKSLKDNRRELRSNSLGYQILYEATALFDSALPGVSNGLKTAATGMKTFNAVLKASVLGIILAAVQLIIATLSKFKPVVDAVQDAFSGLNNVVTFLTERTAMLFKGIGAILSGNYKQGLADMKAGFSGIGDGLKTAFNEGVRFERELRRIDQAYKDLDASIAAQGVRLATLKNLQDDDTRSFRDRIKAAQEAGGIEAKQLRDKIKLANDELQLAAAKAEQDKTLRGGEDKRTDEELAAQAKLNSLKAEEINLNATVASTVRSLRGESRAASQAAQQAQRDLSALIDAFRLQVDAQERASLSGVERVRRDTGAALDALDRQEKDLRDKLGSKFNLEKEFAKARNLVIAQGEKEITTILFNEEKQREDDRKKLEAGKIASIEKERNEELKRIESAKQLALARVDIERQGSLTQEEFALSTARKKLLIEEAAAERRLAILRKQYGDTSPEVMLVRAQIEAIQNEYQKIGETDVSAFDQLKQKIFKALAITEADAMLIAQQGKRALDAVLALADATTAQQIAEQDKLIDAIRDRVEETESLLSEELERQKRGDANSVNSVRDALAARNEELQKAEQERAKIEEKAAKRRLLVNQAQAASEFVLATIKLLSAESSKGVVGIGIALAGIALIAKLVANARAASANITTPGFKDGTPYLTGAGTGRSDSIPIRASMGERILDAKKNMLIGGAALSNEQMVQYVQMGQRAEEMVRQQERFSEPMREVAAAGSIDTAALQKAIQDGNEAVVRAIKDKAVVIDRGDTVMVEENQGRKKRVYRKTTA